jgi:hypothetical protein
LLIALAIADTIAGPPVTNILSPSTKPHCSSMRFPFYLCYGGTGCGSWLALA